MVRVDGDHAGDVRRRRDDRAATRSPPTSTSRARSRTATCPRTTTTAAGASPACPTPRRCSAGRSRTASGSVPIQGFVFGQGDLSSPGRAGAPALVRRGRSLTFVNRDARQTIFHTITSCKAPCNRTTGIAYPLANGRVDFDSGELGFGPQRLHGGGEPGDVDDAEAPQAGHLHVLLPRPPVHARRVQGQAEGLSGVVAPLTSHSGANGASVASGAQRGGEPVDRLRPAQRGADVALVAPEPAGRDEDLRGGEPRGERRARPRRRRRSTRTAPGRRRRDRRARQRGGELRVRRRAPRPGAAAPARAPSARQPPSGAAAWAGALIPPLGASRATSSGRPERRAGAQPRHRVRLGERAQRPRGSAASATSPARVLAVGRELARAPRRRQQRRRSGSRARSVAQRAARDQRAGRVRGRRDDHRARRARPRAPSSSAGAGRRPARARPPAASTSPGSGCQPGQPTSAVAAPDQQRQQQRAQQLARRRARATTCSTATPWRAASASRSARRREVRYGCSAPAAARTSPR